MTQRCLEAALDYARRGIPIFICQPNGKLPATANGFYDATTDLAVIRRWFSDGRDYNIATSPAYLKCGVADVDPLGVDSFEQLPPPPKLLRVKTPRGFHYWVADPKGVIRATTGSLNGLGPGIDTRGVGSYVLLPPSHIEAGQPNCSVTGDYAWLDDPKLIDPEPWPFLEKWFEARTVSHEGRATVRLDDPTAYPTMREWLQKQFLPRFGGFIPQGTRNNALYEAVCKIKDRGVTEDQAHELIGEFVLPALEDGMAKAEYDATFASAYHKSQNEPGSDAIERDTAEKFAVAIEAAKARNPSPAVKVFLNGEQAAALDDPEIAAALARVDAGDPETRARFQKWVNEKLPRGSRVSLALIDALVAQYLGREPDEDETLPELVFWDAERTLPRSPEGAVIVDYGPPGAHKTTRAMAEALAIVKAGGRVVYAVGEGTHGVRKLRLPALALANGLTTYDLRGKWRTVPAVPLLTDPSHVKAFIEAQAGFRPDAIYIDTLASAAGNVDENAAAFGQVLTANGPIGAIRRAFGCLVRVIHHSGKDLAKGSRGHSSIKGNADGLFKIVSDKPAGKIYLHVEKLRDAEDGFAVEYNVTPAGHVPVATKVGRTSGVRLAPEASAEMEKARGLKGDVLEALLAFHKAGHGPVSVPAVAQAIHSRPGRPRGTPEELAKNVLAEERRIQRAIRGAKGKPGPLADLVRLDARGEPFRPYEMVLPEGYLGRIKASEEPEEY